MKIRLKPPEKRVEGVCVFSRCNNEGTLVLGRWTSFLDIDEDADVCQSHWEELCKEDEAAEVVPISSPRKKRNPVQKRSA